MSGSVVDGNVFSVIRYFDVGYCLASAKKKFAALAHELMQR
jgi:hypothetical protein